MFRSQYQARNGIIVAPDSAQEHLEAHHGEIDDRLLAEVMAQVVIPEDYRPVYKVAVDVGRNLGPATLVEVTDCGHDSQVLMAFRPNRKGPSCVMALTIPPPLVSTVVVWLKRKEGAWVLHTAYVGVVAPREVWDTTPGTDERREALLYWATHALVYRPDIMGRPFRATLVETIAFAGEEHTGDLDAMRSNFLERYGCEAA